MCVSILFLHTMHFACKKEIPLPTLSSTCVRLNLCAKLLSEKLKVRAMKETVLPVVQRAITPSADTINWVSKAAEICLGGIVSTEKLCSQCRILVAQVMGPHQVLGQSGHHFMKITPSTQEAPLSISPCRIVDLALGP